MKRYLRSAFFAVLLGSGPVSHAWDASENRQWLQGVVKGDLTNTLTFKLTEQLRYTDEFRFHYYRHTEVGLNWAFASGWGLEPAYRHIQTRFDKDSNWISKPTWGINLRNKTALGPVDFRTRLRFFYTDLTSERNLTDFRPMLTLAPTNGWTAWQVKPFLMDELMYNFEDNLIYRNRFGGGLKLTPLTPLSIKFFIVQEITRRQSTMNWKERYNMGLAGTLTF